ncbi:hypothetical protein K8R43_06735 [archaeon]|nr:hypothetical protein [archaeon]
MKKVFALLLLVVLALSFAQAAPMKWDCALSVCASSGIELHVRENTEIASASTAAEILEVTYKDIKVGDPANGKPCLVDQEIENPVSACMLIGDTRYNNSLKLIINDTYCSFIQKGNFSLYPSFPRQESSDPLLFILSFVLGSVLFFLSSRFLILLLLLIIGILLSSRLFPQYWKKHPRILTIILVTLVIILLLRLAGFAVGVLSFYF